MFNYQACWDRDLPQQTPQKLGFPISVVTLFHNGRVTPKSFIWDNRTFWIQKVNFFWKDKHGKETLYFFSVRTEAGTYEIAFSHQSLSWHINKLLSP